MSEKREIVAFAKYGEYGVTKIVTEIAASRPTKSSTRTDGCLIHFIKSAAERRTQCDENGGNQNRNDGIGVRKTGSREVDES